MGERPAVRFRIRQYGKMAVQHLMLPVLYRFYSRQGIDPCLAVFADAHHNGRPQNMEDLLEAMRSRSAIPWKIEELYLDYQRSSFGEVLKHMNRFMKLYARAGTVVLCDNFLPAAGCRKRKETLVLQLWHACGALKKFGYATTDDIPAGYKGNVFRNTDIVLVSAPFCIPARVS